MEVKIYKNSVVYCDIPYLNTNSYGQDKSNNFDYDRFYKWALSLSEPVIISEYSMPDDFICIDMIEKSVMLNSGAAKKALEKLFIPKTQKDLYFNLMKRR
jgi:site-specific DNA-adenine methylase